jgi:hypothetical protein
MDWLRSEDLKEEKVLTTSKLTITRQRSIYLSQIDLVPFRCVAFFVAIRPTEACFRLQSRKCRELREKG